MGQLEAQLVAWPLVASLWAVVSSGQDRLGVAELEATAVVQRQVRSCLDKAEGMEACTTSRPRSACGVGTQLGWLPSLRPRVVQHGLLWRRIRDR